MSMQLYPHITADADVLAGQPVIEGTAIPVGLIVKRVAAGGSLDDVAREHGISIEEVRAALEYAARRASEPVAADAPGPHTGPATSHGDVEASAVEAEARRVGLDPANLSPLGRRLLELRVQAAAAGESLLTSWEELDAEIAERRGGNYPDSDA